MQFSSRIDTGPGAIFPPSPMPPAGGRAAAGARAEQRQGSGPGPGPHLSRCTGRWRQDTAPGPALNWCNTLMTMGKSRPGALC